jgi:glycosyltransferase involved in cell wall biosynthesis
MTIHVYSIVWNDEFMLPHFLEHYEKFADKIFIIDDHSTDRTAETAKAHPKVEYSVYGFEGLNEQEFNDTFYSFYKNNPSDWAVVVDSDEFIFGLPALGLFPGKVFMTEGYMMIGETGNLDDCKPIRMKSFDKPVVFDPSLDVRFGDGRHTVNQPARDMSLTLYHYKYPSREYYIKRNTEGYARYMDKDLADKMLKRGLDWYDRHA